MEPLPFIPVDDPQCFWDPRFSAKGLVCGEAMNHVLREQVAAQPAGELLDLGQEGFAVTVRGGECRLECRLERGAEHGADGP